jgi:hypothetical protein
VEFFDDTTLNEEDLTTSMLDEMDEYHFMSSMMSWRSKPKRRTTSRGHLQFGGEASGIISIATRK